MRGPRREALNYELQNHNYRISSVKSISIECVRES